MKCPGQAQFDPRFKQWASVIPSTQLQRSAHETKGERYYEYKRRSVPRDKCREEERGNLTFERIEEQELDQTAFCNDDRGYRPTESGVKGVKSFIDRCSRG